MSAQTSQYAMTRLSGLILAVASYFASGVDGGSIACENTWLNLNCGDGGAIDVLSASYGRYEGSHCGGPVRTTSCSAGSSLSNVKAACQDTNQCSVLASNAVFGDPCAGTKKYLDVNYVCKQSGRMRKVVCEGENLNLNCPADQQLDILEANYGRTSGSTCRRDPIRTTNCWTPNAVNIARQVCHGTQSCTVPATNNVFGDPCVGTVKYLEVTYNCKPGGTSLRRKACENSVLTLNCPEDQTVKIKEAKYGRSDRGTCSGGPLLTTNCHGSNDVGLMELVCSGVHSCSITASNSVFGDPCVGTLKYLDVTYTCEKASSIRARACENSALSLKCPSGHIIVPVKANYGRTEAITCRGGPIRSTWCFASSSLQVIQAACQGFQTCSVTAGNSVFGDPCVGTLKYLDVEYKCEPATNRREKVCEHGIMKLQCGPNELLEIVRANYGRIEGSSCGGPIRTTFCYAGNSINVVRNNCQGKRECTLAASNSVFGDPCVGTLKYLDVSYKCNQVPTPPPPPPPTKPTTPPPPPPPPPTQATTPPPPPPPPPTKPTTPPPPPPPPPTKPTTPPPPPPPPPVTIPPTHPPTPKITTPPVTTPPTHPPTPKITTPPVTTPPTHPPTPKITTPPVPVTKPTTPKPLPGYHVETICEHEVLNIKCGSGKFIHVNSALYGRTQTDGCSRSSGASPLCSLHESMDLVCAVCEGENQCSLEADNMKLGEPCLFTETESSIFLKVNYSCKVHQPPRGLQSKVFCQNEFMHINCQDNYGSVIEVVSAKFWHKESGCGDVSDIKEDIKEASNCLEVDYFNNLKRICDGRKKCGLLVEEGVTGAMCNRPFNSLKVEFQCKKVPTRVRELFVYKKGRLIVGLAWSLPLFVHGILDSFRIRVVGTETSHVIKPTNCVPWPDLYCFTLTGLTPNTNYTFEVSAKSADGGFGAGAKVTTVTVETAPGAPVDLTAVSVEETSARISWKPPRQANGLLRSFLLRVEEINSYDPTLCCQFFPMKEVEVTEEAEEYSTQVVGLSPGSAYAVSVTAVTAWLGAPALINLYTRPPTPSDILLPTVQLNTASEIEWKPSNVHWEGNYTNLVQCNLLLLVNDESKSEDILDVIDIRFGGDAENTEWTPKIREGVKLDEDVADLTRYIEKAVEGNRFQVVAQYDQGDEIILEGPEREPVATKCGLTATKVPLTSGNKYRLAAVEVLKYNGLYSVGAVLTKPFTAA